MNNPDPRPEAMKADTAFLDRLIARIGQQANALHHDEAKSDEWAALHADLDRLRSIKATLICAAPAVPLEVAGMVEKCALIADAVNVDCEKYPGNVARSASAFWARHIAKEIRALAQQQPARIEADDDVARELLFGTNDPSVEMDGKPLPAMTTLLHRVCDDDPTKFEEAARLVSLFIKAALARAGQGTREDGLRFKATVGLRRQEKIIDNVEELLRLINGGAVFGQIALLNQQDKPHSDLRAEAERWLSNYEPPASPPIIEASDLWGRETVIAAYIAGGSSRVEPLDQQETKA